MRLKARFQAWQGERTQSGQPATQEAIAERLGFGQSATSQYLNGSIPLNPRAATKFAQLLGCDVRDFSPTVADAISALVPASISPIRKPEQLPMTLDQREQAKQLPSLVEIVAGFDFAVKRASPETRAELRKVVDLYLTDPVRYGSLAESMLQLLGLASDVMTSERAPAPSRSGRGIAERLPQHLGPPLQEDFDDEARHTRRRDKG